MRRIEIDDDLYEFLCKNTSEVGESKSSILRRLLGLTQTPNEQSPGVIPRVPLQTTPDNLSSRNEVEPPFGGGASVSRAPSQSDRESIDSPEASAPVPPLQVFLRNAAFVDLRQAVDRFLYLLTWLYMRDPARFQIVQEVRGKRRLYFSLNPEDILQSGQSTQPRRIPGTPWYVITNNDTGKKQAILAEAMYGLRYTQQEIEEAVAGIDPKNKGGRSLPPADHRTDFGLTREDDQDDTGLI